MKLNGCLCFGLCLFLGLLFQACTDDDLPQDTKTIRIQVKNEPDILNPALSRLSVSSTIEGLISLPIATWDKELNDWSPILTKTFEGIKSDKGITYPLVIRPEARWSDGHPISTIDLMLALKMGLNPHINQQSWAAYIELLSEISRTNDSLVLKMDTPYILADEFIAGLTPYPAHILDPEDKLETIPFDRIKSGDLTKQEDGLLKNLANTFNKYGTAGTLPKPVSGLFRVGKWTPEQNLTLTRVSNFWGHTVPEVNSYTETNIDSLQFVFIPDPQNALHAFTSGSIDILNTLDSRDSGLLSSFAGEVYDVPTLQLYYIALNHQDPLLSKNFIRKALNMALNRKDIVERLFHGNGQPIYGPIHPDKSYHIPLQVRYDPEAAKNLLINAGCRDKNQNNILECPVDGGYKEMTFHIWTTRSQVSRNVATLMKGYWEKIGIHLNIQSSDFRSFLPELQQRNYDMATLALRQHNVLDDPFPLWHSSQATTTGKNYQALRNDSIDYVLEQLRQTVNPKNQRNLYHQFQELFAEEVPVFFLVAPDDLIGVRENVNLYWTPNRPGYNLLRSNVNP